MWNNHCHRETTQLQLINIIIIIITAGIFNTQGSDSFRLRDFTPVCTNSRCCTLFQKRTKWKGQLSVITSSTAGRRTRIRKWWWWWWWWWDALPLPTSALSETVIFILFWICKNSNACVDVACNLLVKSECFPFSFENESVRSVVL